MSPEGRNTLTSVPMSNLRIRLARATFRAVQSNRAPRGVTVRRAFIEYASALVGGF